jgi:HD-GYP domain-containing protein (c-di-GMP phosphodiesterase class II)
MCPILADAQHPLEVLVKPDRLSDDEMRLIQSHSEIGRGILKDIEFSWPVAEIVFQHHERINGSGYPQGLAGDAILLEARILCAADVVEAMASDRPYRAAIGLKGALEELSINRGVLYDPAIVDVCHELFTKRGFKFEGF